MDSIEDVYKQYAKSVYKFLLSKTFDSHLAEELTQETFFQAVKSIHKFQKPLKEVMYLRITGDLSFKEIGEILGKNENWARVTFYRGKEKLIKEVKKHE